MSDNVHHPKHYNSHPSGVECITVATPDEKLKAAASAVGVTDFKP